MILLGPSRPPEQQSNEVRRIDWESQQAQGLLWHWPLNDGGLVHYAQEAQDGAIASSGIPTPVATRYGIAKSFSGSNDIRATPTSALLLNATLWTACVWAKFDSFANAYNTVISAAGSGSVYRDLHVKSTGKLACYVNAGGPVSYDGTGANTLSTGIWYHLAITYAPGPGVTGYVNAVVDGSGASAGAPTALPSGSFVTVGNNPPAFSTRYINGQAFDARFYGRVLSAAELADIRDNGQRLYEPRRIIVPVSAAGGGTGNVSLLHGLTRSNLTSGRLVA